MDVGFRIMAKYMEWLAEIGPDGMLFRGHADQGWELTPSAFRDDASGITEAFTLGMWIKRAAKFISPRPTNNLEWLVLAQHYGIPTNLLDWTSNPLTALYFAAQNTVVDSDGKIFATYDHSFSNNATKAILNPFCVKEEDTPIVVNVSAMNVRSMAQDGYMTIHCQENPSVDFSSFSIKTFLIPNKLKSDIIFALDCLGISEDKIYRDLSAAVSVYKKELRKLNEMRALLGDG